MHYSWALRPLRGEYFWEVLLGGARDQLRCMQLFIGVAFLLPGSSHPCWRDVGLVNNHFLQSHALASGYGITFAFAKGM